jgi:predicted nucleotidyltransferase
MDINSYNFFQQLARAHNVEKIILFGSRARGDNRPRSDLDLAIYGPRVKYG